MPKVTVYICCYNYERYVKKAIESVLQQTYEDYELIIIDDGSTDNSKDVIKAFENHQKVHVIFQENLGLAASANKAIEMAKGEYIIRLDADDYFDENILFLLTNILSTNPNLGLVYSDYYEVDEKGDVLQLIRRKKIGEESQLLDVPAHGACTMVRLSCLKDIGGYDNDIKRQDGYDLWIKFIQKYQPYNINLPLFYYRKHATSLTTTPKKVLEARKHIKENFVKKNGDKRKSCIIIPVRSKANVFEDLPLKMIDGKPLAHYAIDEAIKSAADKVILTTEDETIAKKLKKDGLLVILRPKELAKPNIPIEPTVTYVLNELKEQGFVPDIVGVLFITSPLVKAEHLNEAINTIIIYDADSVVSVKENHRLHYSHGEFGLVPLFKKRGVKSEREYLFEESGAFIFSKKNVITKESLTGKTIGHVILTEDESIDIEDAFSYWLVKNILENREEVEHLEIKKIGRGY